MAFTQAPFEMFQSLMCRSAVPPPEASTTGFQGHQANAWKNKTLEDKKDTNPKPIKKNQHENWTTKFTGL